MVSFRNLNNKEYEDRVAAALVMSGDHSVATASQGAAVSVSNQRSEGETLAN